VTPKKTSDASQYGTVTHFFGVTHYDDLQVVKINILSGHALDGIHVNLGHLFRVVIPVISGKAIIFDRQPAIDDLQRVL